MTGPRFMVGRHDEDGRWRLVADFRTNYATTERCAQIIADEYGRQTTVVAGSKFAGAMKHARETFAPHPAPNPPLWTLQNEGGTAAAYVHGSRRLAARVAQQLATETGQRVEAHESRAKVLRPPTRRNPKPRTITGAVALVIRSAGYNAVARDLVAGRATASDSLRYVIHWEKRPAVKAKLERALELLKKVPAGRNPVPAAKRKRSRRVKVAGAPRRGSAKRPRKNPSASVALRRAGEVFREWHGFEAKGADVLEVDVPAAVAFLGEVTSITYRSNKWTGKMEHYKHGTKSPRPLLCVAPDRRTFLLLNGGMKATARGLVG